MTTRDRFIKTMNFEPVDCLPVLEWAPWWNLTVDRWKREGLTIRSMDGYSEYEALQLQMGLDLHAQSWISFTSAATPRAPSHGAPIITSME